MALGAGSILAFGVRVVVLGVGPDMMTSGALIFVGAKVSFGSNVLCQFRQSRSFRSLSLSGPFAKRPRPTLLALVLSRDLLRAA